MVVVAVVALLTVGCGGDDEDEGEATTSGTAAAPARMVVEATEYSFSAPDQVAGGVVSIDFRNAGRLDHEAFLLSIGDMTEDEALAAFEPWEAGRGSLPDSLEIGGGVAQAETSRSEQAKVILPAGRYLLLCTLTDADSQERQGPPAADEAEQPPHYRAGMRKAITVTDGAADAADALPEGDGTITGREYTFDLPDLTAGTKELAFENAGPEQPHHVEIHEFPPGVDPAGAQQAYAALAQAQMSGMPPPPGTPFPTEKGGAQAAGPGRGGTFRAELVPGRTYAVVCFLPDRGGGLPHIAKGMLKTFTV